MGIEQSTSKKSNINLINIEMQEGTVKFFNDTKGFGFITPSNGDRDVFVHTTGLLDNVQENDKVTYDIEHGQRGCLR